MKVLQINTVCGTGSTGRIATDIYSVLKKNGHDCKIAYGRGSSVKDIDSIKIGSKFDNYIHGIKTRLFDIHGFASTKATKTFIKKAKEYDPDIIHLHNIHGYYINIELLFKYLRETNKPVVWTLHDCWSFTGHCAYFDYVGCQKWKIQCHNCPQIRSYPESFLVDNSKRNYKRKKQLFTGIKDMTIITPSNWLESLVKQSFLKDYTVKVIHNGIDLEVFNPKDKLLFRKKYNLSDKFIVLGVANIWDARKGFGYFIQLSNVIDSSSIIVLVGLNDNQLKSLPNNVIGIKRTNNVEELAAIYSLANVFINPTLEDNFPTTNIEALACGTPVITFNTGGSVECIDEKCGLVVKKGSLQGLQNAIYTIKENKYTRENCVNRAKLYNKTDRFNEYLKVYLSNS